MTFALGDTRGLAAEVGGHGRASAQLARMTKQRGRLLGLTGPKHCGKSTVAKALRPPRWQFWAPKVVPLRFAGPLKEMLHVIGLDERHTDGELKEQPCDLLGGTTPRSAMETLGTDWGRECVSGSLWLDIGMARALKLLAQGVDVVFEDVRFDNEANAIIRAGGTIVELRRRGTRYSGKHPSDRGLSRRLIDATVANDGPLDQTLAAVRRAWAD